jgi:fatty-acyl-CoA synthase
VTAAPPVARRRRSAAQTRRDLIALGWVCAVLSIAVFALAVIGFRQGWISYAAAKNGLAAIATPVLALLAVAFGAVGLILAFAAAPRAGAGAALGALAVGALVFAVWSQADRARASAPPVHDVSTDWTDPPVFSPKVMMARGPRANPVELAPVTPDTAGGAAAAFAGRPVAEVNARTCPAATPLTLTGSVADAYARAKAAIGHEHMALITDDATGGVLEASAARGLWGVTDDLKVRVRPEGAGARVDLRSVARAGLNDGGADCARVTRLRRAIAG